MAAPYTVHGFADTRAALVWVGMSAPDFRHGFTLEQVFAGIEHGYRSVRTRLKDPERIAQWEQSREKMLQAFGLFQEGNVIEGKRTLQQAEELFAALRRIKGKVPSRQELGDTEHGSNELDE